MQLILSIILILRIGTANLISEVRKEFDKSDTIDESIKYQIDRGKIRIKAEHFKNSVTLRTGSIVLVL